MKAGALFFVASVVLAGCSNDVVAPPTPHTLGEPIALRFGHSVFIPEAGLGLSFVSVQDGRCPKGALCMVAAPATVGIQPSGNDVLPTLDLQIYGLEGGTTVTYREFEIYLAKLTPYLMPGQTADPSEYVATIVVTRP